MSGRMRGTESFGAAPLLKNGVVRDGRRNHSISCNPGLEGLFELFVQESKW